MSRYNETLRRRFTTLAESALADLRSARLSWSMGTVSFMMNRRKPTPQGIMNAPHPRGYVDRAVPVLRIDEPDGALRGLVFGCACHNTTLGGDNRRITADYAGYAQRYVEKEPGVSHAMFVQGFGASCNPYPRGSFERARKHGEALGLEVCRVLTEEADSFQPVRGPLRVAFERVDLPIEPPPEPEEMEELRRSSPYEAKIADKFQALLDSGEPWATHYASPFAVWQFGEDLTLACVPGEVVGEWVPVIEKALGPLNLWPAGYCNDYYGYLPTERVHEEGGYEGRDFITGYGYLARETESVVIARLCDLAKRAGRRIADESATVRTIAW